MTDNLIEQIRAAVAEGATAETRAAGANACRTLLAALDTQPGAAMGTVLVPMASPVQASQIAAVISALRGAPPDQLLDLAIQRLRAALPAGADVSAVPPLKFQIIPTAQLATLAGGTR